MIVLLGVLYFCCLSSTQMTAHAQQSATSYTHQNPAKYDKNWGGEQKHDEMRSKTDCFCDSRKGTKHFWNNMLMQIRAGVKHEDDSEDGPLWVHGVCAKAYSYIFKMITTDPETDAFTISTDCSAGLLSMLVVCARSVTLYNEQALEDEDGAKSPWIATERVVASEGNAVEDFFQPMDSRTCRKLCDANKDCKSLAHGPHGCHLKDKCVNRETPLAPAELFVDMDEGDVYRTHYRVDEIGRQRCGEKYFGGDAAVFEKNKRTDNKSLGSGSSGKSETSTSRQKKYSEKRGLDLSLSNVSGRRKRIYSSADSFSKSSASGTSIASNSMTSLRNQELPKTKQEELSNLMLFVVRTSEFCMHCLDDSEWPFTLEEIRFNYGVFLEDRARFRWTSRTRLKTTNLFSLEAARQNATSSDAARLLQHEWALEKFKIRWTRAVDSEVGFWHGRLSHDPELNSRSDSRARLKQWLDDGSAPWAYDDMCDYVEILESRTNRTSLHILNAGSGPFAPREIVCAGLSYTGNFDEIQASSPVKAKTGILGEKLCIGGVNEGYGGGAASLDAANKCAAVRAEEEDPSSEQAKLSRTERERLEESKRAVAEMHKKKTPVGIGETIWESLVGSQKEEESEKTRDGGQADTLRDGRKVDSSGNPEDPTSTLASLRQSIDSEKKITLSIPITSADGLGKFYVQLYSQYDMTPPTNLPIQCQVEELGVCFPVNHFDITHMRNALDHTFDPLIGLKHLLHVTRPGGMVLLRHAQNEGVPGEFRVGLHQWAFDVEVKEYVTRPVVGFLKPQRVGRGHFIVWNPELRIDVTEYLLERNLAWEIIADLVPHPSGTADPTEKFVWVDIIK